MISIPIGDLPRDYTGDVKVLVLASLLAGATAIHTQRRARDYRTRAAERTALRRGTAHGQHQALPSPDEPTRLATLWATDDWWRWEMELAADRLER